MQDTEFMTIGAASVRTGINRTTLRQRVREGLLPAYLDPRDRRLVLLRVQDVERLNTPQRISQRHREFNAREVNAVT